MSREECTRNILEEDVCEDSCTVTEVYLNKYTGKPNGWVQITYYKDKFGRAYKTDENGEYPDEAPDWI